MPAATPARQDRPESEQPGPDQPGPNQPGSDQPGFGEADLTDCDREPIHIPGSIQPHGLLLVVAPDSLAVLQVAGDTRPLLGHDLGALIGLPLDRLLPDVAVQAIRRLLEEELAAPGPPTAFDTVLPVGRRADLILHRAAAGLMLEIEPLSPAAPSVQPSLLPRLQRMVARVAQGATLRDACQAAAEAVRMLTGFDRVMVYRFLEDDSGAVIAEARHAELGAFLGLHFPASDIPRQARELYRKSWIRLIPDAVYVPAPIEPALSPLTGAPPDLGRCVLRSISPLHLEYLANLGVRASMSLSLVRGGKLWGLIACHHRTPRPLPFALRAGCEVFAQMVSLQLDALAQAEDFAGAARRRQVHEALVQVMAGETDLACGLIRHRPNLLDFVECDGVALLIEGRYAALGRTPEEAAVRALAGWLDERPNEGVVALDRLPELYPPAAGFAELACGALVLALSREPRDTIIWFRPEVLQTVTWAGNPDKPAELGPAGAPLPPRRSFEAWRETVRGRSRPWTPAEVEAAQALRVALLEVVLRRLDEVARERAKAKERQDFLMAELDHRVKNTLAGILSLARTSSGGATSLDAFIQEFGHRLRSMAQAHDILARSRWEGAGLRMLVEEELRPHRGLGPGGGDRVTLAGPELRLKPKAALALNLALHELTTNAAKYGALSVADGVLRVEWRQEGERVLLDWVESHGPPVAVPARRGFGTTVIERGLAYEIGAAVSLDFDPAGLRCRVEVPLRQIVDAGAVAPRPALAPEPPRPDPGALRGCRVLVVEDATLVAMELEAALASAGIEIIGPAASLEHAVSLAGTRPLDAALLDIDLDGELVYPAADLLLARGVPIAFTTGYDAASILPPRFRDALVLPKPFSGEEAFILLRRMLGTRPPRRG